MSRARCGRQSENSPIHLQPTKDDSVQSNESKFAGIHLIVEFLGAVGLDDVERIDRALRKAAAASGATLLQVHTHRFAPQGVTGVALLAESHISVHTWPERSYGAFDVFMCGDADPHAAVQVLRAEFLPVEVQIVEHLRGNSLADVASC